MTARAEEIAADVYPDLFIRDDKMKTSGTALISDAAQMLRREGFINGYKQGQQDRWISVEEDLPEGGEDVLVLTKWGVRDIAQRDWQQGWKPDHWSKDGSRIYEVEDITHWQPLPSPPNPEQR